MKKLSVIPILIVLTSFTPPQYTNSYDITTIYKGITPASNTKVIDVYGGVEEAETILMESTLKPGRYAVKLSEIDNHVYKIEDTELYIELPYCYKYSFYEQAILIIDSNYSFYKGKVIFED